MESAANLAKHRHRSWSTFRSSDACPRLRRIAIAAALWVLVDVLNAHGATVSSEIGQIKIVKGQVLVMRRNEPLAAKVGDLLQPSDVLVTGADGSVGFTLIDNSRISAGPNSRVELKQFRFDPTSQEGELLLEVDRGTLAVVSGQIAKRTPEAMKVRTPTSILGVRGTTFAVKVNE